MPPGHGEWIRRVQRTAEDLGLVPVGLEEIEFNLVADASGYRCQILSIEYWSSLPRTNANHTEVLIPDEHQNAFNMPWLAAFSHGGAQGAQCRGSPCAQDVT